MESTILKYLKKTYKANSFHNDVKEPWDNNAKVYGEELVREMTELFAINYGVACELVEKWLKSVCPAFNLKKYWAENKPWGFENVEVMRQLAATAAAMELVAVKPLEAQPIGNLFYLDYQYEDYNVRGPNGIPSIYGPQGVTVQQDWTMTFMSGLDMI